MSLSKELDSKVNESCSTVMMLDPYTLLRNGSFERSAELYTDKKNTYNCNNNVFNIYDENGTCFVTADAPLVERLAKEHPELKKADFGVELSNGMNFSSKQSAEKWNAKRDLGMAQTNGARQLREAEAAKAAEKAAYLAELRGTAKAEPAAVKKTEMSNAMAGKVMGKGAEM